MAAYERFNRLAQKPAYSEPDKAAMIADLLTLKVLTHSGAKVIKQPNLTTPLALLRENRGDILVERKKTGVEIVAAGRGSWIGWLELVTMEVNETATRMTAKVVAELQADILAVVEAENRPSLVQFNSALLGEQYRHVMLVDVNDPRGIDVGLMTDARFPISTVRSHVDDRDVHNPKPARRDKRLFSRDAPVYRVETGGEPICVIVNHLKSQSRTGDEPPDDFRGRQADRLAEIYTDLIATGAKLVAVVGDLNRGVEKDGTHPSLEALFDSKLKLVNSFSLANFKVGPRDGTFQGSSLRDRLDLHLPLTRPRQEGHGRRCVPKGIVGARDKPQPTPRLGDLPRDHRIEGSGLRPCGDLGRPRAVGVPGSFCFGCASQTVREGVARLENPDPPVRDYDLCRRAVRTNFPGVWPHGRTWRTAQGQLIESTRLANACVRSVERSPVRAMLTEVLCLVEVATTS